MDHSPPFVGGTSKHDLLNALWAHFDRRMESIAAASRDAAAYATDEEAKADSKWDTQGLEASYLAAGQANLARELATSRETLREYQDVLLAPCATVEVGALVSCMVDDQREYYFLVPVAGGIDLKVGGLEVTTISLQTPVGRALHGKRPGDRYELPNGLAGRIVSVA